MTKDTADFNSSTGADTADVSTGFSSPEILNAEENVPADGSPDSCTPVIMEADEKSPDTESPESGQALSGSDQKTSGDDETNDNISVDHTINQNTPPDEIPVKEDSNTNSDITDTRYDTPSISPAKSVVKQENTSSAVEADSHRNSAGRPHRMADKKKKSSSKTVERRKEISKKSAGKTKEKKLQAAAKSSSKEKEPQKAGNKITGFFTNIRQGKKEYLNRVSIDILSSAKWIFFGILCGAVVGTIASIFAIAIRTGNQIRASFPPLLFGLPVAGIIIVYAYHRLGFAKDGGTNLILEDIRKGEEGPIQMAPLIFIGTILTHMFGGSAGREGAALQIGGSIGNGLGRILHFKSTDTKRVIMCGMSAAFSALFGTPLAAAILPIEISTVGIMYYSSLVPCVLSSLVALYIAQTFGLKGEAYSLGDVMPMNLPSALLTVLLSLVCAFAAILFCTIMDKVGKILNLLKNDYIRAAAGGVIIILMTVAVGSQTYNGAGTNIIELCFENKPSEIFALAFLLKMIFTAVTLGSGYKGGEIVPSLFIGATLGVRFGALIGFPPSLCAALGMCALFCGVTNCPVASLLICFEMFGFDAMPYFLLAVSFTYLFSGNFGLYHGQVIRYSKYEEGKVNVHTHH